ncbi:MAG: glycosyltransferase, partial [Gammaproteobacteria bacterium]|nr:glycosyltransferase [Gammaproteobacteria bacterium]
AAAARVHEREPRARFLFAGYEGDPAPFEKQVRAAGIEGVARVAGRIAHDEFADALNASDVFISVPSVDATAVSLLEAMSCGRAVIVSSLASAREWVRDGENGRIVAPRAIDQLTGAMLEYAADAGIRDRHGLAALVDAAGQFGFDQNMQIVDAIFTRLTTGAGDWPEAAALDQLRNSGGPG